jgi:putative hydrolase of the HAD superfamily
LNPIGAVEAVTFDVGGTLIEPFPSVGHVYCEVAAAHGVSGFGPEALNQKFKRIWSTLQHFNYTREEWKGLVDRVFEEAAELPSQTFFEALYARFADPEAWRIYEDVQPALEELSARGVPMGLISNWDERLHPLLRSLRLHDYFRAITVSCEVGYTKPAHQIFDVAAARLGIAKERILHVGDNRELDIDGARLAGFQALRLQRDRGEQAAVVSDRYIKSLRELLPLMNSCSWQS